MAKKREKKTNKNSKKSPAKKSTSKKSTQKKSTQKKSTAKKSTTRKSTQKKSTSRARKTAASKSTKTAPATAKKASKAKTEVASPPLEESIWEKRLNELSQYLFQKHREKTLIVSTFLLCSIGLALYLPYAHERWNREAMLAVQKEVFTASDEADSFVGEDFTEAEKKLERLQTKTYQGSIAEPLLLQARAYRYYQHGTLEDLRKAKALYQKLKENFGDIPTYSLEAEKKLATIEKEIQTLLHPPAPKTMGVLKYAPKGKENLKKKEGAKEKA
ncbi:MAG: hypothetical protein D6805_06035 [Planctomycetota bacterium]|nr:MAG: hypothetical protein D6805_06035 [Planctomycetota bacterium]